MMKSKVQIELFLQKLSQPLVFENVTSTYEKGSFFCVYLKNENIVYKYPIRSIFRVKETYNGRKRAVKPVVKKKAKR